MTQVHNFRVDLAFSEAASCEPFWDAVYRKAFPDLVAHVACPGNTTSQRQGVDRLVHLGSGRTLKIDEKKRRGEHQAILLEYLSNDKTGAPGWMEKELQIDYLAYAFMPTSRCYLFPWDMLRRAWLYHRDAWKKKYFNPQAQNPGYRTHSVAVPVDVLRGAVSTAAVIDVSTEMSKTIPVPAMIERPERPLPAAQLLKYEQSSLF